jgi:hypothetical protein
MPPMLCLSPVILDQSFPRDERELKVAALALGRVAELMERGEAIVVITEALREIVTCFDCGSGERPYPLIEDLFALLDQWLLQPSEAVVTIKVPDNGVRPHPLPVSAKVGSLVDMWAAEVGGLLVLHNKHADGKRFFIGVACELAFAGHTIGTYRPPPQPCFPLVGPEDVSGLDDARRWNTAVGVERVRVTFANAHRNIGLLGALSILNPTRGSHYKVVFPGTRPWPLDPNVDPVAERFIKQLVGITGFPISVIKSTLVNGRLPAREFRLKDFIQ